MTVMGYEYEYYYSLRSDQEEVVVGHMAEDESRTCSSVNEEEVGSSSKEVEKDLIKDERWLQLGLGGGSQPVEPAATRGELVELDLLPIQQQQQNQQEEQHEYVKPLLPLHHFTTSSTTLSAPLIFPHPRASLEFPPQEIPSGYRPFLWNPIASSSSIPPPQPPMGMYYPPPFQYHGVEMAGPSSGTRVIDVPTRPRSNVWFMLKASQNQAKEPFLPQIPKSYLRIKDGRMTVRLLMKYLVNKLRLNKDSEVEITCRGQKLPPFFTLQYVRDNVWTSLNVVTLNPDSSTADHVMILNYGRSAE